MRFLLTDGHGSTINGGHLSVNNPLAFAWRPHEESTSAYLRVEIASGFMKGHGRLVLVQPGQGSVEVRKLHPLGADKVKDNSLVKAQR